MSLDLEILSGGCKHCGRGEVMEHHNYTYNASPMWYAMFPEDESMVPIEGLTGEEADEQIKEAIYQMIDRSEEMKRLEPENGWGSYTGFLQFLERLHDANIEYPNGIWRALR